MQTVKENSERNSSLEFYFFFSSLCSIQFGFVFGNRESCGKLGRKSENKTSIGKESKEECNIDGWFLFSAGGKKWFVTTLT